MATALYTQPFSTNSRTIIGLVNLVLPDDYVLLCNTSLSAVTIDLPTIPLNFWSTQYKLFIVDSGNNSAINNITINAPAGYTVNGLASVTLSINGSSYMITISSNTNFVALYGGVVSGSTSTGLISVTNAQLLTLIGSGSIIGGQFYLVTDALFSDGGVVVQGVQINKTTTVNGSGIFLNADYQGVGDYSNVVSYANNVGIWGVFAAPVGFVTGSVAIYNNINYLSLNGVWASDPTTTPAAWLALTKTATNGYITAIDQVRYNILTNQVVYRADTVGNEVDLYISGLVNSLTSFQWGRTTVTKNKVRGNSYIDAPNSYCTFLGNILESGTLTDATIKNVSVGVYQSNQINGISSLSCSGNNNGSVVGNQIERGVTVILGSISNLSGLNFCKIADVNTTISTADLSVAVISDKRCESGFSNFEATLDMTDPTVYSNPKLYFDPVFQAHIGIFYLKGAFDEIREILNSSLTFPTTLLRFFTAAGFNQIRVITVGLAVDNEIVGAFTPPYVAPFTYNAPIGISDTFTFIRVQCTSIQVNRIIQWNVMQ